MKKEKINSINTSGTVKIESILDDMYKILNFIDESSTIEELTIKLKEQTFNSFLVCYPSKGTTQKQIIVKQVVYFPDGFITEMAIIKTEILKK